MVNKVCQFGEAKLVVYSTEYVVFATPNQDMTVVKGGRLTTDTRLMAKPVCDPVPLSGLSRPAGRELALI